MVELHQEGSAPAACAGGLFLCPNKYFTVIYLNTTSSRPSMKTSFEKNHRQYVHYFAYTLCIFKIPMGSIKCCTFVKLWQHCWVNPVESVPCAMVGHCKNIFLKPKKFIFFRFRSIYLRYNSLKK